jgi:uncharacterized membrane protein YkoI
VKTSHLVHTAIVVASPALFAGGCASSSEQLAAQAETTRAQAGQTALARVPGGKITEGELEKEHGNPVWSFDIVTSGSKDSTEIQVDASTGQIISREAETPEQQAKEAKHK